MQTPLSKDSNDRASASLSRETFKPNAAAVNPTEIAREVIKRLAREKLPPTPENFSAVYRDISGEHAIGAKRALDTGPAEFAVRTALALAERFPAVPRQKDILVAAIRNGAWHAVDSLVDELRISQASTVKDDREGGRTYTTMWRETAQCALQCSAPLYLSTADLKQSAVGYLNAIRHGNEDHELLPMPEQLQGFASKLAAFRNAELRGHLQLKSLMSAVVKNVTVLNAEQGWLAGQLARVDRAIATDADDVTLRDIEASLRDTARRQDDLKKELDQAKLALRDMLNTFIAHLGDMAESTGEFSTRVDAYALAIENAGNMTDVTSVVNNLLNDTRSLNEQMIVAKDDLTSARSRASVHEERVRELESELVRVSELVRTDHLTQALNRRGLDAAFDAEAARAERNRSPLCLAVIDIDNFKALNDAHGHCTGDDALKHLSQVIRDAIRPTDVLARIGGEEFVVLLPETPIELALKVTQRLQRQLTRDFFLAGDDKLFITFSAGVTEVKSGELQQAAIDRADKALYRAKQAGKNRVLSA